MFSFLKNIFDNKNENIQIDIPYVDDIEITTVSTPPNEDIEKYFLHEIEQNKKYFKNTALDTVLKHLTQEINLNKTGTKLTADEKKALGLNARIAITTSLIDVLSDEGVHYENDPKSLLSDMYNRAVITKLKRDNYKHAIRTGITQFKFESSGGGFGDCAWCISMQKKKFLDKDEIEYFLENKCDCKPYSYSMLTPIIEIN